MSLWDRARDALHGALTDLARAGELGDAGVAVVQDTTVHVERPKRPEHGDLATNAAMVLTKKLGMPPRAIADKLVKALAGHAVIASAEVAGPGFVNLRLTPAAVHAELDAIRAAGTTFGRRPSATGERVDLEFVSANPTGPLTIASARNAVLGDTVARLLEATGNRVTREYYINDFGNQVRLLGESVVARAEGREVPEDGYKGDYVVEIADYLRAARPEVLAGPREELVRTCITLMVQGIPGSTTQPGIRKTLSDLGIDFDVWFSEESLHRWGHVPLALAELEKGGFLEAKDGALFFVAKGDKSTEDKERAVRKSDGAYTYFASDIAYFQNKMRRGYDRLLIVLGADHHGYVARIKNALEALGLPSERFEAMLYQLVFIIQGGELAKSSKREGKVVRTDEVLAEIDAAAGRKGAGADAVRFFFLSRAPGSQVEFDVDLAKKASLDNPVFYVQYGHARLCSILRKAKEAGLAAPARPTAEVWSKLTAPEELALAAKVAEWPIVLDEAAKLREPHRVVFYAQELARDFQSYFTRFKKDPIVPPESVRAAAGWEKTWDLDKTRARLAWIEAIRAVYAGALGTLGVHAPERMDRPADAEDDDEGG